MEVKSKRNAITDVDTLMRGALETRPRFSQLADEVKLVGYDFCGHTRGTLVVGIADGYPYYKGSAIFSLVFLSTTSEKSFIP